MCEWRKGPVIEWPLMSLSAEGKCPSAVGFLFPSKRRPHFEIGLGKKVYVHEI
jgi:hypothetical protein